MCPDRPTDQARLVLLVDDTASSAAALELVLSGMPAIAVRTFANGEAAWSFLGSAEGSAVRAVITDLDMPLINGLELIRRIRSSAVYAALPILVVSGTTDPTEPQRALEAGADAFFPKPWSPGRVCATLEHLLYEREPGQH